MIKINSELREEVMKGLSILEKMNTPIEIRMLKTKKGTRSGYYSDKNKLLNDIQRYDGVNNIFFTLNSFEEDLMARGKNRLLDYASNTTSDSDITRRNLLLIDIDPCRASGISSTDEELEYANEVAKEVNSFLNENGFAQPVKACSGNGYHLLYKLDLPNTKEVTEMIKSFLQVLDSKFSTEKAKVDTANYNPARITKLYGTIACKGDSIENRPHRRSKIVEVPEEFKVVDESLINKIAELMSKKKSKTESKKQNNMSKKQSKFDVKEWLDKYDIEISRIKEDVDRVCYVLKKCPWNSNHTDTSASVTQFYNGAISAKCHHDSCSHENWSTLKELYEPKASKNKSEYSENKKEESKKSHADIVIEQALNYGDVFFHNSIDETFVAVDRDKFYEIYRIEDKKYQMLLRKRFYDEIKKAISKDNVNQAIGVLEAKALYEGKELEVYKRCAEVDGTIYYYLCDKNSTIIRIDEDGWGVDDTKKMLFIRKNNMSEQVMPEPYEDLIGLLSKHFRFKSEEDKILHAVSLVTRLIPNIPHPIEVIHGEKGLLRQLL